MDTAAPTGTPQAGCCSDVVLMASRSIFVLENQVEAIVTVLRLEAAWAGRAGLALAARLAEGVASSDR